MWIWRSLWERLVRWWPADHSFGRKGERIAARHLRKKGYKIIARSARFSFGELDLVALDGKTIVFVEVKTRRSNIQGDPSDAVGIAKQRQLVRLAQAFFNRYHLHQSPARFDVVSIVWPADGRPQIEHLEHAFDASCLR